MFGGQSHVNFCNDLAPYVNMTREKITNDILECNASAVSIGNLTNLTEIRVERAVRQSMQGVCYNLNTMHSRAGSQVPFSSVNLGIPDNEDSALLCKIFLEEYDKGMGKGVTNC